MSEASMRFKEAALNRRKLFIERDAICAEMLDQPTQPQSASIDATPARAPAPVATPGDLRIGTGLEACLREGWSHCEDWGVWTDGSRAELILDLRGEAELTEVELRFRAFLALDGTQALTLLVDGRRLARVEFNQVTPSRLLRFTLRRDAIGGVATRLTFIIAQPTPPAEVGPSVDTRQLGLGLEGICFRESALLLRTSLADRVRETWLRVFMPAPQY